MTKEEHDEVMTRAAKDTVYYKSRELEIAWITFKREWLKSIPIIKDLKSVKTWLAASILAQMKLREEQEELIEEWKVWGE